MSTTTAATTCSITTSPLAGRLKKLAILPFGRSRWHSRYFVLLDSELRSYKDEHAISPVGILNLCQIRGAVAISVDSHPYCIRLEPRSNTHAKPWTVACASQVDHEMWLGALCMRIDRLYLTPPPSPKRSMTATTLTWLRNSGATTFLNINKHSNKNTETATTTQEESFYHAITHDECIARPRPKKTGPVPSLSRRRGVVLAPIIIEASPFHQEPTESDDGLSSLVISDSSSMTMPASSSSGGGLFNATTAVQPSSLPGLDTDDHGLQSIPSLTWLKKEDAEVSPSFLYYKERFRLF